MTYERDKTSGQFECRAGNCECGFISRQDMKNHLRHHKNLQPPSKKPRLSPYPDVNPRRARRQAVDTSFQNLADEQASAFFKLLVPQI